MKIEQSRRTSSDVNGCDFNEGANDILGGRWEGAWEIVQDGKGVPRVGDVGDTCAPRRYRLRSAQVTVSLMGTAVPG